LYLLGVRFLDTETPAKAERSHRLVMAWQLLLRHGGGLAKARPEKHMTARSIVGLLEEMMDVKLQQYAETTMRPTPELARLLQEKRETDRRRLDQIRAELVRILE
jgi:hypothetical protein